MSLVISLGTNIGNKLDNLEKAKKNLSDKYHLIFESSVYSSSAVDYLNQPDFYNQILEFKIPNEEPIKVLEFILSLELTLGRVRSIDKGPRVIDIDILFWKDRLINLTNLTVPHPRLFERSFICLPLKEIPYYNALIKQFKFPSSFNNTAFPL